MTMNRLVLAILGIFLIIPGTLCSGKPVVYCDDTYGTYTALAGNLMISSYEFPIMSTIPPGSSGISDLAIPKVMHPCFSLSINNNYKNQLYDIFTYGEFGPSVCQRQCAHFVAASRLTCGDRRPPPTWQVGTVGSTNRKINCSNWDLPLTEKGKKDGIFLTYFYATYTTGTGTPYDAPFVLNNKSVEYLDGMFIKGFHMKPMVDPAMKTNALDDMEEMLDEFVGKHPEMTHVAFGNPVVFFGDVIRKDAKFYAPRFEPTDKFYETLAKIPSLTSLALSFVDFSGNEKIPSGMTKNLKSIGFYNVTMAAVPSWAQTDQLQFLEFQSTLTDKTGLSVLDKLPGLEHFLLTESSLTSVKSPFLAQSSKLLSLTLQCNAIESIADGAFDHLTELKFLNLAGNRIVNLPKNLLANLDNLLVLDLKTLDEGTAKIQTFNELSIGCQIGLNYTQSQVLKSIPKMANPAGILALDIRGQKNFLEENGSFLADFKNVEVLNIGNLELSSLRNLSLETLCNLGDLNVIGNSLSDEDWIDDELFVNLNLQYLRLGQPKEMTRVPNSLVAFMRTASQIMYSAPSSLNFVPVYKSNVGCEYDTLQSATMFAYKIKNSSCSSHVANAIEQIRKMELLKMDTQCR